MTDAPRFRGAVAKDAPLACLRWFAPPAVDPLPLLRRYSPNVARASAELFYLDASGLVGLYASQQRWAAAILAAVAAAAAPSASNAALALGYHPEALALLVQTLPAESQRASPNAEAEQRWLGELPLQALALPAKQLQLAEGMGLHRLQDLAGLAQGEVHARLGAGLAAAVAKLRRAPSKVAYAPAPKPCVEHWQAEQPCRDACQLLFVGKALLDALLRQAVAQRKQVAKLTWVLHFAPQTLRGPKPVRMRRELVAARPSNDAALWTQLLRLWLGGLALSWGVEKFSVGATLADPAWVQAPLWPAAQSRNVLAAHEGLAKVRATFGEGAVVRAQLVAAHLPEARFVWQHVLPGAPLVPAKGSGKSRVARLDPLGQGRWPRLRRIFARPQPAPQLWVNRLHQLPRASPLDHANAAGRPKPWATNVHAALPAFCAGPVSYSHGWWDNPVDRDYFYVAFGNGAATKAALVWLYYARQTKRWWWHGTVD